VSDQGTCCKPLPWSTKFEDEFDASNTTRALKLSSWVWSSRKWKCPSGSLPFYADLLRIDKNPQIQPTLSERVLVRGAAGVPAREETVTLPELPGVASFSVRGTSLTLPSGFRMI